MRPVTRFRPLRRVSRGLGGASTRLRSRADGSDRGAVLPIVALFMVVLVLATSLAVDIGRLSDKNRDLQKIADLVSLDAVRAIGAESAATLVADGSDFVKAVEASAARNSFPVTFTSSYGTYEAVFTRAGSDEKLIVDLGTWDAATRTFSHAQSASDVPTAVKVAAGDHVKFYFGMGVVPGESAHRSAVAKSATSSAWFKVGSSLVALNAGTKTVVGELLNQIAPGASALGWAGIVNAPVNLEALETHLPINVGSPDQLLNSQVSLHDLVVASIAALQESSGNTANIALLNQLLALAPTAPKIRLGDLIGVDASGGFPAGQAAIGLWQLLTTSVFLFNGNHAIEIPGLDLGIPGVASVDLTLQGIEPPQIGGPEDGASATTKQVQLVIKPKIDLDTASVNVDACKLPKSEGNLLLGLLGGVLTLVKCLLGPIIEPLQLSVDATPTISLSLAKATVTQHIDCDDRSLSLSSVLSPVRLNSNIDISAQLLGTDLLGVHLSSGSRTDTVNATSTFAAQGTGPTYKDFSPDTAQVGSVPLGLSNVLSIQDASVSLLDADLPVLGNLLTSTLVPLVNNLLGSLDTALVTPLAGLLGLNLGGAQLWPLSMNCLAGTPELAK